ncbi:MULTISPECIES: hypothetical protein [Sphingobium]|uniref:Uncharacterized protein n=1 Tax=Sphingobium yanoikuyae ATCC 51230 TaxID=883163 RepID=K9DD98_SPHYA|nr:MULTISPECIES: hypothetical protein [Sphingobium]EKU75455.1 hypothetical protein HMPREF9718_02983 [Sphingobium yanoikuyae ATCC 51230]WQE07330.1 hypothetical protein U0025_00145 [Sphingobium yanoikuyae]SHL69895.1 hypothetical protein SAMN05518668_102483 [Sphingobium sp. YR657]
MAGISKTVRWLLLLCYLSMLVGLGLQRFDGGLAGNWSIVLLSFAILNLAFMWDGIVRFVKK